MACANLTNKPILVSKKLQAFCWVLLAHSLLLFLPIDWPKIKPSVELFLDVRLANNNVEEAPSINPQQDISGSVSASTRPSRESAQAIKVIPNHTTLAQQEDNNVAVSISAVSELFKQWLESETREQGDAASAAVEKFARTFDIPIRKVLPDIKYKEGPLGGGNYKIRKNGVTCEQLTMVPLSFYDFVHGTATTSGKCRKEETIKLNLKRLNK